MIRFVIVTQTIPPRLPEDYPSDQRNTDGDQAKHPNKKMFVFSPLPDLISEEEIWHEYVCRVRAVRLLRRL
jgi:hypothetical protein